MTADAGAAERAGQSRRRLTKSESLKNSCFKVCNCSESLHNTPCLVKLYSYFVLHTHLFPHLPFHPQPHPTILYYSAPHLIPFNSYRNTYTYVHCDLATDLSATHPLTCQPNPHRPVSHTSSTCQPHPSQPLLCPHLNPSNSKECEFFLPHLTECWSTHSLLVLNCSCKSCVTAHSKGCHLQKAEPREGQRRE